MPHLIQADNVSDGWLQALAHVLAHEDTECTNLMVNIQRPLQTITVIDNHYNLFCAENGLTELRKVADTVFPQRAYEVLQCDRARLYTKSNRIHKAVRGRWGSYFNQMINWSESSKSVTRNQLEDIITSINERDSVHRKAYVIHITNPVLHLGWPRGGPCLHSVYIQLRPNPREMSIMAVYRSHDFGVKAYGNYIGLGNLLQFLAKETNFAVGNLSCVSSTAFIVAQHKAGLRRIIDEHSA